MPYSSVYVSSVSCCSYWNLSEKEHARQKWKTTKPDCRQNTEEILEKVKKEIERKKVKQEANV
jgi:GTPase SAR1 family protein